jgi:hypothetical protein
MVAFVLFVMSRFCRTAILLIWAAAAILACPGSRAEEQAKALTNLNAGQSLTVRVRSHEPWNHTGVHVMRGQQYRLTARGIWWNFYKPATADGYESLVFTPMEHKLREPEMLWLALAGCIDEDISTAFLIGRNNVLTVLQDGELTCFANDIASHYRRNWGSVRLTITRIE